MATSPYSARDAKPSLLIVDDDALITDTLAFALGPDFEVHACDSRANAVSLLRQLERAPELALVDLGLPPTPHGPEEGFLLIADLLAHSPAMKIFVLSGQNDDANARHARALGAWEFVAKPSDPAVLRRALLRALELRAEQVPEEAAGLVGHSPAIAKLRDQVAQFADSPFPVLIEGESGSGKELVAQSLHRMSSRAAKPYLALNCAAIAPTLVEAALFGYAKGAFTGASLAKSGYFEDARDGTLFLDEIGELPPAMQVTLLRVLENGEFQRLGETQQRVSGARVIAATNRDLRHEVRRGNFRADLYHRLSVLALAVPPLRELDRDKVLLLEHFRRFYAAQLGVPPFALDEAATQRLLQYPFPGNVRELRNIVIRLMTKYGARGISVAELEAELDLEALAPGAPADAGGLAEQAFRQLERGAPFNLDDTLKGWERAYIEAALQLAHGNISQAAKLLGVNRTTLYGKLEAKTK
ncbi:MAG: sigma-54-dependent Fis family transcriptional regulator [Betaproteobacteria bacterium RIFCSPLOWO2_12_FULL_68_20]|nr:MAG: sigma-54-dependent Fis family transcriptional regulator [Betaproteobacteria bacterium RIFCSPLOWO2_12_FULL_68_20]